MPWRREHDENSILISNLSLSPSTDGPEEDEFVSHFQSPADILAASSELLAHLQRSGLRFLPKSIPDAVIQWTRDLDVPADAPPDTAAGKGTDEAVTTISTASEQVEPASVVTPNAPPPAASSPAAKTSPSRLAPVASTVVSSAPYPGIPLPVADVTSALESLARSVAGCTRCKVLASCRTQTVFGEGSPQPRFVFLGEAPGAEEDQAGRPFVGEAGQLLTKMIEAIHLRRDDVYLLNTVKCRPPGNRNPGPDEVANCREYLETQLQLLRPEYIVCLGTVSSQALLQSKLSIGRLRQTFHQYHDSKVLAIYHPTYLLRNPDAKRATWADLQLLMKDAGLQ